LLQKEVFCAYFRKVNKSLIVLASVVDPNPEKILPDPGNLGSEKNLKRNYFETDKI
jgi:hypothetical protein